MNSPNHLPYNSKNSMRAISRDLSSMGSGPTEAGEGLAIDRLLGWGLFRPYWHVSWGGWKDLWGGGLKIE